MNADPDLDLKLCLSDSLGFFSWLTLDIMFTQRLAELLEQNKNIFFLCFSIILSMFLYYFC